MTDFTQYALNSIPLWDHSRLGEVEFSGDLDPILPTPFRIGSAAAASLAAVGLAVSDLWELRTGRRQQVKVDTRQATASLRSSRYMTLNGEPAAGERNAVMGVYPARNGRWSYLHCNFPNHREAALSVLGVEEDRAQVREAVSAWDALELEEAIIAARGAGGMVRTMQEWAQHPQSAAVASLPLLEIDKIGEAPPQPLPQGTRPLSGIRVLDLTRVLAGPTCARTLAEHGADVMKIAGPHLPFNEGQEHDTGHGKLSAHLDLRKQSDVDTLKGLGAGRGYFFPGLPARRPGPAGPGPRGPGRDTAWNRLCVPVRLWPRGSLGRTAGLRYGGADGQRHYPPAGRAMFPGAEPGPQFYPVSAIDYLTGYLMAYGALTALARRAREGGSWLVRLSLAQTGRWLVGQGQVPESELSNIPSDFTGEEIAQWSTSSQVPGGELKHLAPVLELSETRPYWARPSVPLGYHDPVWPERSSLDYRKLHPRTGTNEHEWPSPPAFLPEGEGAILLVDIRAPSWTKEDKEVTL